MTEEQEDCRRAATAVAKMIHEISTLRMHMPANLAVALQATAKSLEVAQGILTGWQARLRHPIDNDT